MVKGKKQSPAERRGDNISMYFIFVKLYRVSGHHLFLFCLLNIDFFLKHFSLYFIEQCTNKTGKQGQSEEE